MRTDPNLLEIVKGQRGMLKGVEACLKQQCLVSAVTLIYSSIDSLAALTRPVDQRETKRAQFLAWVKTYLLPGALLSCTAEDLYGGRCGVLHTYSPDSGIRQEGKAKALIYHWKSGPPADAELPLPPDAIVIAIDDLADAFKTAANRFLELVESDPNLVAVVDHHRKELLCYKPFEVIMIHVAA